MPIRSRSALALLLAGGAAFPSAAGETLTSGFTGTGFVELFYATYDDDALDDEGGIYGDFDLSFRPSGGSLGFDVGAFAARSDEAGNGIFYWAGTWYTPNGGKVSLGNPRSAYDLFERSVHNDAQGVLGNFVLRSQMQTEEFFDGGGQYGISYLGRAGALSYGVSLHSYEFAGLDITAVAIGGTYRWQDYRLSAAYEDSDADGGDDFSRFKIGLAADYGTFGFGTTYRVFDDGDDTERSWETFGFYHPTERIELTASFQSFSGDPNSVLGLAAKYRITDKGYARAGAIFNETDNAYSVGIGYDF
jgi:hypothetical protein